MKWTKIFGILLILLGVAICAVWLGSFTSDLYEKWSTNATFQSGEFGTFWEHFWSVGKLDMVLSVFCGGIPVIAGIYCLRKK